MSQTVGQAAMETVAMVSDFFYPNAGGVESHIFQVLLWAKLSDCVSHVCVIISKIQKGGLKEGQNHGQEGQD